MANEHIPINRPDRGEAILRDPAAYFAEARKRAAELVERDMAREKRTREEDDNVYG